MLIVVAAKMPQRRIEHLRPCWTAVWSVQEKLLAGLRCQGGRDLEIIIVYMQKAL